MIHTNAEKFPIVFSPALEAKGLFLERNPNLSQSLRELDLVIGRPTLVLIGGATLLGDVNEPMSQIFTHVIVPIAEQWNANVIDGGTDSGVMSLIGQARAAQNAKFPLIGVVPEGLAIFPKDNVSLGDGRLEPNHTHFFLVPGDQWGDESPWLANIATELAKQAPSITILVNGGEIAWKDAQANVDADRILIVIEGTGRTADLVAAAARGEETDQRAISLLQTGLVKVTNLKENTLALAAIIEDIFQRGSVAQSYAK